MIVNKKTIIQARFIVLILSIFSLVNCTQKKTERTIDPGRQNLNSLPENEFETYITKIQDLKRSSIQENSSRQKKINLMNYLQNEPTPTCLLNTLSISILLRIFCILL